MWHILLTLENGGAISYNKSVDFLWASFDGTTNPIVTFPDTSQLKETSQLPIHLWLQDSNGACSGPLTWQAPVSFGTAALLQTSTNLINWDTMATVVSHGGAVTWLHWFPQTKRFFRVMPNAGNH